MSALLPSMDIIIPPFLIVCEFVLWVILFPQRSWIPVFIRASQRTGDGLDRQKADAWKRLRGNSLPDQNQHRLHCVWVQNFCSPLRPRRESFAADRFLFLDFNPPSLFLFNLAIY